MILKDLRRLRIINHDAGSSRQYSACVLAVWRRYLDSTEPHAQSKVSGCYYKRRLINYVLSPETANSIPSSEDAAGRGRQNKFD